MDNMGIWMVLLLAYNVLVDNENSMSSTRSYHFKVKVLKFKKLEGQGKQDLYSYKRSYQFQSFKATTIGDEFTGTYIRESSRSSRSQRFLFSII